MATNINSDGGNSFLGFIVGGLLVVVVILGALYYNGNLPGMKSGPSTSVTVETPSAPSAPSTPSTPSK